tara:strand:- start:165 stop:1244 length:1080 start_codon:yes stop_codon:yes gene_type:complete
MALTKITGEGIGAITGDVSVDGGTIKLDGNYPVGTNNVALGDTALDSLTSGNNNTAIGSSALTANTTASNNVAVGYQALDANTTGQQNTAIGSSSLDVNTTGTRNTSIGYNAMGANTTATANVAIGDHALQSKTTTGNDNVAIGTYAGSGLTTGANSTFVGSGAGQFITTGNKNTVIGGLTANTLRTGNQNTIIGYNTNTDSNSRTGAVVLGYEMGTFASNNSFRVMGAGGVYNTGNTSSWNTTSDSRIKKNIADSTIGLAEINQIRVRTFEYRTANEITDSDLQAYDLEDLAIKKTGTQVGCIAQELNEIIPSAIVMDDRGVYNVQDDELKWHLIKAVQELSAKNDALEARIATLEGE